MLCAVEFAEALPKVANLQMIELLHVPFNLRIAVDLLDSGMAVSSLRVFTIRSVCCRPIGSASHWSPVAMNVRVCCVFALQTW